LLKFSRDRRRWLEWLFQAKKRYGLRILNYAVTLNHIHLLVIDDGGHEVIPRSIQLVAGRVGQEFNQRKKRRGAFWEDRYHAAAVEKNHHLIQCLIYIDLNMVRAGEVNHPSEWPFCGYNEIQKPRSRYRLIDHQGLMELLHFSDYEDLAENYRRWVAESLARSDNQRDGKWTQSIAVGSKSFIEEIKTQLGSRAQSRKILETNGSYHLRESQSSFNRYRGFEKEDDNTFFWNTMP